MLTASPITTASLPRLANQYQAFVASAQTRYGWHATPPDLEQIRPLVEAGTMEGVMVVDDAADPTGQECDAFMLYASEDHGAIEINVVFIPEGATNPQTLFDVMMRQFLGNIQPKTDWETVSFAMLGCQGELVATASWYGLQPVGQAIQQFDMTNELALPILHKQHTAMAALEDLNPAYRLTAWEDSTDIDQVADVIYQSFHNECDAFWDPRFTSVAGAKQALEAMQSGRMGDFRPEWQTLLYQGDQLLGFCFLLHTGPMEANIALIGIDPAQKRKGLGQQVLRYGLVNLVKGIAQQQYLLSHVTATMGTDNLPAIHLYRKFGFQEVTHYPHTYLTRETAAASYVGKAIFGEKTAGCCH